MKFFWYAVLSVNAIAVAVQADTADVFRVDTTLHGIIERGGTRSSVNQKVKITTEDLINLAQARDLGTPVPQNEILAIVNDCSTNDPAPTQLVIFDTTTSNDLVVIGTLTNLTSAIAFRKRSQETITQLSINDIHVTDTNGVLHGVTGGSFFFHEVNQIDTNACPKRFGGQLTGFLGTAFPSTCHSNVLTISTTNCVDCVTNCPDCCASNTCHITTNVMAVTFPCTDAINVIIPRSPLTTGGSISKFPPPQIGR